MAGVQNQIHTRHQASGIAVQCINASSSEGHAEYSDLEGTLPTREVFFYIETWKELKNNQKLIRISHCLPVIPYDELTQKSFSL